MRTLLRFGLAAGVTYLVVDAIIKRAGWGQDAVQESTDAANPPSSVDEIPTLQAVPDAAPRDAEPLQDDALNAVRDSRF